MLMILKNIKFFHNLFQARSIHKYIYNMDKAYFRELKDTEQFQLSFKYVNPELNVDRQFNFCRRLNENVESLLGRVTTNVEKVVNRKNKRKKNDTGESKSVLVSLLCNDEDISKESLCNDIFKSQNKVILGLIDKKYHVIINAPWIDNIVLPNSILATFPVYPSKFEFVNTDVKQTDFLWLKSQDKTTWIEIGRGFSYTPTNEDIGYYLKISCTPKKENLEGPTIEAISTCTVEAGPGTCPFEIRHAFTSSRLNGKEFRVVSYNILADLYCDSDHTRQVLFPYCPPYALSIDYRKQLLRKEIVGFNADIICLQEVDSKVYKHDLNPILSQLGYSGEFSVKGGEVVEGLAFFYNNSRFQKLHSHRIVFAEILDKDPIFADIWEKVATNSKLSARILDRTTTLQVNVVESLENDEILVVANIHLYFHPDADHIRLIHGGAAIRFIEHFVTDLKNKHSKRISLIFCGDFNSIPDCGIYKLYTTGEVPSNFIDYQSNKEESIDNLELKQPFSLDSACGKPKYTNYTSGFAECLDYIFYQKNNLSVIQVVPFPSDEEVMQNTALPSITFPSDHISLIADLKWN